MKNIIVIIFIVGYIGLTILNRGKCPICTLLSIGTVEANEKQAGLNIDNTKAPITLNSSNFDKVVLNSDIPIVVDFWAAWCGPCKKLSPVIDELTSQFDGKIKFGKVDVDQNSDLSDKYSISSIPHLIVFKKGKAVEHIIGLHNKQELEEQLKSYLN